VYYDVGDRKAREKTSQALRDGKSKNIYSELSAARRQSGYHATLGSPSVISLEQEYFGFSVQLLESLHNDIMDEFCHPSPFSVAAFHGKKLPISRTAPAVEGPVQVAINHFIGV
jgi:hypothetical protein